MNFCESLCRTMRFPGQATHVLALAIVLALPALAWQDPQSSPQPAANTSASQDAAAKATERRKHFEEEKRRLEESDSVRPKGIGPEAPSDPDQTLFIFPAVVNMLVGESHSFSAFELVGKTVTPSAEWTLDNSDVVELSNNGGPTVISKAPGKATLCARISSRTAKPSSPFTTSRSCPTALSSGRRRQVPFSQADRSGGANGHGSRHVHH